MNRFALLLVLFFAGSVNAFAQDAMALVSKVKAKLDKVKDYTASGKLRTDVSFIKIPDSDVQVFFKNPDKFKIKKKDGISVLPKGGVSINIGSLLVGENFAAVPAGKGTVGGVPVSIVKMLPLAEQSDVALSTLYIDEKNLLIRKAVTTTKQNGTYEMELNYGKYASWGLPDKVIFSFSTKDFKLPKGVAMEYETGVPKKNTAAANGEQKGKVEITYASYTINKGVSDAVFK
ncbi:MAG: LolA family protein [Chitinophagaceae bacterium]